MIRRRHPNAKHQRNAMIWILAQTDLPVAAIAREFGISAARTYQLIALQESEIRQAVERVSKDRSSSTRRLLAAGAIAPAVIW